jgi:chitin synthase
MGCYIEGIERSTANGKTVTAQIFEHTLSTGINIAITHMKVLFPIRIIFCLKEQKQEKLNSHRWLFNAFCPLINPKGRFNIYPRSWRGRS